MSKFLATQNKGFQMTFSNGLTISVQWGTNNYCSNRDTGKILDKDMLTSATAEIAIWDRMGFGYNFSEGRNCEGWVSADEVAKWISKVSMAESLLTIEAPQTTAPKIDNNIIEWEAQYRVLSELESDPNSNYKMNIKIESKMERILNVINAYKKQKI